MTENMKKTEEKQDNMSNELPKDGTSHDSKKVESVVEVTSVDHISLSTSAAAHKDEVRVADHKLEQRICRKFDARILPMIACMYLFNSIDKGNISNAKTDGLATDLGMVGNQWNNMLSIFYVPFVIFAFPLAIVIKKYGPANVIPWLMFGFGSITLLMTSVFNYGSLMAGRWFLGMCESAFFPGIIYYLSTFYRRDELARRLSVFYGASNIANAFSGLLSYGVFQIESKLKGWQYLFLIEGTCSVIFSLVAFMTLPRSVETAKFLTPEERECAIWRMKTDSSSEVNQKLSIKEGFRVFKHPLYTAWVLQDMLIAVPLNSYANWFPQIVESLGKGTVMTNLYTVAPNVWGAFALCILGFSSDFFRMRAPFLMIAIAATLIGFVVFGCINTDEHVGIAYFSCFLMTTGTSASSVLTSTWYNNNTPNQNMRMTITTMAVPLANSCGLISANIFMTKDAPKYLPALYITAAFGGAAIVAVAGILAYMIYDNKRRDKNQGIKMSYRDVPTYLLAEGPSNPSYRWMY